MGGRSSTTRRSAAGWDVLTMTTLAEKLLEHGIRLRAYADRNYKIVCPQCSSRRHKKTDPCLSVTIEGERGFWLCHHCQWKGSVGERNQALPFRSRRSQRAAPTRPVDARGPL